MANDKPEPQRPSRQEMEDWVNAGGTVHLANGGRISSLVDLERAFPSEREETKLLVPDLAPASSVQEVPAVEDANVSSGEFFPPDQQLEDPRAAEGEAEQAPSFGPQAKQQQAEQQPAEEAPAAQPTTKKR
jgi:hypothetical protein